MSAVRTVLRVAAIACRLLALALVALVALDLVMPTGARTWLLSVNGTVSRLMPSALSGLFVIQTPLEGSLRGDYLVFALVLLVIGQLCGWVRRLLRPGR